MNINFQWFDSVGWETDRAKVLLQQFVFIFLVIWPKSGKSGWAKKTKGIILDLLCNRYKNNYC